jgi:hypothetical protein
MSREREAAVVCIMNGIGDAFLALTAIRYLRCKIGESSVFVLTTPQIKATIYAELGAQVFAADQSGQSILKHNAFQISVSYHAILSRFEAV